MSNRPYSWTGEATHLYDDIISLPRPVSRRHAPMSMLNRAAQFAPYAALVGYGDSITEAARLTDDLNGLFDDERQRLNETLFELETRCQQACALPFVTVTYFLPDDKKAGGAYLTHSEPLKRVDSVNRALLFKSGKTIPLNFLDSIEWNEENEPE